MTIKSNINDDDIKKRLDLFRKRFLKKASPIIKEHSLLLINHLRTKYMSGPTTDTTIRRRTGNLANSMRPAPIIASDKYIDGGVTFGKVYSKVHIGRRGRTTTIVPKNKQWLTVPFPNSPILTDAGVTKATAAELKDGGAGLPFGKTFIAKSKAGNLIIFGTQRVTKGANIGAYRGDIVPLFILKKKVKIKTRVHPEIFLKWSKDQLTKDFREKGVKASIIYG